MLYVMLYDRHCVASLQILTHLIPRRILCDINTIILILQMKKIGYIEAKCLVQGHTVSRWNS